MSVEDARFTDSPYSLKSTGGGNYAPVTYNKLAQSVQRIAYSADWTIEWGNCSLPFYMGIGFATSDNTSEGLDNMEGCIFIDTGSVLVQILNLGVLTHQVSMVSLNQTVGGDTLTIFEDSTLWRIRKVGSTVSYQVKPRGDAGSGAWATIHSQTLALGSSPIRVEAHLRFPNSYWNGVRLYGSWA